MNRMRTAVIAATALVALLAAGVAMAATLNTYTATIAAKQSGAGTAKKPVALGLVEKLAAKPVTTANAYPLTDIKLTLPDVKFNDKGFPVCSAATITAASNDSGCPKGALVASGDVTAALWSPSTPSAAGASCNPVLDIWNAGNAKLTYFFKIPAGHQCAGLQTGAVPAWTGTMKESGSTLTSDTPLPPPVSTNAGNLGLYSSLEAETLTYYKLTAKVGGKTVPFFESVGCVAGKRPYTVTYTATNGSTSASTAVKGSGKC
jgi:hypothetical protein